MTARVMRFRADQMAEEAAGVLAVAATEKRRQDRARTTRAQNGRDVIQVSGDVEGSG